mmetsp:Transcript_91638/g.210054  ORF Transcript_91638/g.210054 Transcript_91638/m.210054 type:complete len:308 (-) Transcript_91638:490-1413(-)
MKVFYVQYQVGHTQQRGHDGLLGITPPDEAIVSKSNVGRFAVVVAGDEPFPPKFQLLSVEPPVVKAKPGLAPHSGVSGKGLVVRKGGEVQQKIPGVVPEVGGEHALRHQHPKGILGPKPGQQLLHHRDTIDPVRGILDIIRSHPVEPIPSSRGEPFIVKGKSGFHLPDQVHGLLTCQPGGGHKAVQEGYPAGVVAMVFPTGDSVPRIILIKKIVRELLVEMLPGKGLVCHHPNGLIEDRLPPLGGLPKHQVLNLAPSPTDTPDDVEALDKVHVREHKITASHTEEHLHELHSGPGLLSGLFLHLGTV